MALPCEDTCRYAALSYAAVIVSAPRSYYTWVGHWDPFSFLPCLALKLAVIASSSGQTGLTKSKVLKTLFAGELWPNQILIIGPVEQLMYTYDDIIYIYIYIYMCYICVYIYTHIHLRGEALKPLPRPTQLGQMGQARRALDY